MGHESSEWGIPKPCKGMGGIHIQSACVFKVIEIKKNAVTVSFTVGGEEPDILVLQKGDFAAANFNIALDDFKVSSEPLLNITDAL